VPPEPQPGEPLFEVDHPSPRRCPIDHHILPYADAERDDTGG
jgi:hypothetical protein